MVIYQENIDIHFLSLCIRLRYFRSAKKEFLLSRLITVRQNIWQRLGQKTS